MARGVKGDSRNNQFNSITRGIDESYKNRWNGRNEETKKPNSILEQEKAWAKKQAILKAKKAKEENTKLNPRAKYIKDSPYFNDPKY